MHDISDFQVKHNNFDPYAGRKLTGFLYNTCLSDITAEITTHHLIFGDLTELDRLNWWNKLERMGEYPQLFEDYEGGYEGFLLDAKDYFINPNRFFYTPLVMTRAVNRQFVSEDIFSGAPRFPEDDYPDS